MRRQSGAVGRNFNAFPSSPRGKAAAWKEGSCGQDPSKLEGTNLQHADRPPAPELHKAALVKASRASPGTRAHS